MPLAVMFSFHAVKSCFMELLLVVWLINHQAIVEILQVYTNMMLTVIASLYDLLCSSKLYVHWLKLDR